MTPFTVNDPERLQVDVRETPLGDPIIVIDDFYAAPDEVAAFVRDHVHERQVGFYGSSYVLNEAQLEHLDRYFRTLLCEPALDMFSFLAKVTTLESVPHVDALPIACTIYLNGDDELDGGTGFFRHAQSGVHKVPFVDGAPSFEEVAHAHGYGDLRAYLADHRRDRSAWHLYDVVPMRFNRAVVYSAGLYHSHHYENDFYGPERPRLSQNVFLRAKSV